MSSGYEDYLITPKLEPKTGEELSFYLASQYAYYYANTTFTIEVSTTTPEANKFTTTLATYTSGSSGNFGTTGVSDWVNKTVSLSDYVGQQIYIAFHVKDIGYNADVRIDNVSGVSLYMPSCPKPTSLALSTNGATMTATWNANVDAIDYNVSINGTVYPNATSTNSYTFDVNLSTNYTVMVEANCAGSETSGYCTPVSLTTPNCIGGHTIEYTLNDSYGDGWNGASISVIDGCGTLIETLTVPSSSYSNSGTLDICANYVEFIWTSGDYDGECSFTFTEGGSTLFTKPGSISNGMVLYSLGTLVTAPTSLTAGAPDMSSVVLNWTENGTASSWQICINGDESNLITANTNVNYTLSGLAPDTDYTVKVRAYIDANTKSCWSNTVNFTTEASNCPKPTNVTASNLTINSANISWNGNADSYNVQYATATVTGTTLEPVFTDGFESGLGNWITYASSFDNEATNWRQYDATTFTGVTNHTGNYVAMSRSYGGSGIGDVSVDNWLVSPQMTLGDVVKFWVAGDDNNYQEYYAVYVSTRTNATGDFEFVEAPELAPGDGTWAERTVDLSAYAGQQGYIAIRHTDFAQDFLILDDFGVYKTVNSYSYGPFTSLPPTTETSCNITGLRSETLYVAQVQSDCDGDGTSGWSSVYFTTPDACSAPTDLVASNITATTATLGWSDNQDSYNVQYRKVYFFESFEGENLPTGWTTIDANSDGNCWTVGHATTHSGSNGAANFSYIYGETGTTPDDFLVSPLLDLQGTLRVWLSGITASTYEEYFSIYVSTTGNTVSDFTSTTPVCSGTTTNQYVEYTADLSSYAGQQGYIAIRHHNCSDQRYLYVDDFGLYGSENWVSVSPNPTDATASLSGLSAGTDYEWQVQGISCNNNGDNTSWSATSNFTTLYPTKIRNNNPAADEMTWAQFAGYVNGGYSYAGQTVTLMEDIEVTAMVGTSDHRFGGTFDGQGYKINVGISSSEQGAAPFRYISGATIQNLKVDGTVTSTAHHASGLVGFCADGSTNTIQNCHISTNVSNSNAYNGDGGNNYMGGLIGHNMSATTSIIGCVYDGTITSQGFKGGMVGFGNYDSNVTITNSYFAGAYSANGYSNPNFSPIACHGSGRNFNFTFSNFYYNTDAGTFTAPAYEGTVNASYSGTGRAKHAYTVTGVSPVTVAMNGSPTTYNVSGIAAYGTGIMYDGTIYGGSGDVLALSLDGSSCGYEIDHGNLSGSSNPYSLTMEADNTVISAPVYTISASVNPAGTGTVSGTGSYICGATATLEATANTGYHFVNWTKNSTEVSTSATYNFTVTEAADYVANFEINTYTVTAVIHPSEGGSATGAGEYTHGSSCTLVAPANSGYQFVNWTASNGSVVSSNASYTFIVTGDVTYQANFTKTTVTPLPWTENFEGYSCGSGTWEYLHGEWATPLRWTKAACVSNYSAAATSGNYSLEMRASNSDNMVVLPQFDQPLNKLKIKFQIGRGNASSGYTVKLGYVTNPSDASTFHELSSIDRPSSAVPNHTQYIYDLTTNNNAPSSSSYRLAIKYTKSGEDSWYLDDFDVRCVYSIAVSDNPSSTASSLTGAGKYDHGATCTVSATAGDCYNFVNWTENGTEVSTSASYSFTATADRNLVANFTQWTLNIDNNQTSLECINTGTEVVLTASATSNSTPTYEWAVSSGSTEGTASSNTYTVSPTALSNTYTVSATVGGCVVSASNTVTVKPVITNISSSEGDDVCFGLTTELAATCTDANASYSWNSGAGTGSSWTTPAITATTNFTVVATGLNSCTVESTKSIGMKVPGNQPMTHVEHGAIWTGYEGTDWSDEGNWVYFDGNYRTLEGLSDTLNLILRTGDSDKCILNNPVISSPTFASNSGMIVRRPITIGEGTAINIDGDLNVESGSITLSSTGALLVTGNANIASGASVAFDNKDTLSIAGNLVLEGSLDFPESDTTPALRLGGNLVIDGGSIEEGGTLVFAGSSTQNVSNGASPLTLNNNVRMNMHRSRAGVPHTVFPDGTIFSKTTIFEYGIMDGNVTFNATGRTIVCGGYESYASGTVTKIGAGNNFTFPTGDDNVLGSITARIASEQNAVAKFHHKATGFTEEDGYPRWWNVADMCGTDPFNHVSNFEYWDFNSSAALSGVMFSTAAATAAEHFHDPSEYPNPDNPDNIIQVAVYDDCWRNGGGDLSITADFTEITISNVAVAARGTRGGAITTLGSKSKSVVLPIELTSFTATCDGRSSLIEWTTATERNNDYFSLERSDDAINFTEIARVAGAGNSIESLNYSYTDYGIHGGDNYYRLVQVDYDGTRTVSDIVVANCVDAVAGDPEVLAYPNPFNGELTLVLDNFDNRAATIEVYDMLGKQVFMQKADAPQNSYETILNLSNLPSGTYTVRVSTTDFVINKNVVKQ